MKGDNASAHSAADYEAEVKRTLPFHDEIIGMAIHVAVSTVDKPRTWLDTGAGPGELVAKARALLPDTRFLVADPSPAMVALARSRLTPLGIDRFFEVGSADLPDIGPVDVVTAIQCHHYGDASTRERAVTRCCELLSPGGAFVVFENVRAETDPGHRIQRARWADWQRARGRDAETVERHLAREGTAFFPIRVSEHEALLRKVGFGVVELIWRAYGQAGFLAINA